MRSSLSGITRLKLMDVRKPEGPVRFKRWASDQPESTASDGSISTNQLARVALACSNKPNFPLHVDRLFSAGGNTRSALETLLAHTPHFFMCYPDRSDSYTGITQQRLKHIMWCPNDTHPLGELAEKSYDHMITEIELGIEYDEIRITPTELSDEFDSIEAKRTHTQMQIALVEIGNALNFDTWIAKNDQHIPYGDVILGEVAGVIASLENVPILYKPDIKDAAQYIDAIWFADHGDRIPAVLEVEHSTGVTSGLTRMRKLLDVYPSIATRFVIVAPNDLRTKVINEANLPLFKDLEVGFMPYSTIRELYGLIQRYELKNVVDYKFIHPFIENITAL